MKFVKFFLWCALGALLVLVSALVSGCSSVPGLKLKSKDDRFSVTGNRDAGTPATAKSGGTVTTLPLAAGSKVTFTPAPSVDAGTVSVELSAPSEFRVESHAREASTGTIDTATAQHRIDTEARTEERKPLLWAAIICGVAGVLARIVLKEWPAIGNGLLAAAALAGVAWKVAEIPWWAFLAVIGGVVLVVLGYKRAEWDQDGDGIPDVLQRKKPTIP